MEADKEDSGRVPAVSGSQGVQAGTGNGSGIPPLMSSGTHWPATATPFGRWRSSRMVPGWLRVDDSLHELAARAQAWSPQVDVDCTCFG